MPGQMINTSKKPYIRIVQGNFVQTVDKNTESAKLREYELPNGEQGQKWELRYMSWTGRIRGFEFKETDYGTVCNVDMGDCIISLNTSSRYFADFAQKICGADLKEMVTLHPYDLESEGKRRTGVSVQQGGEKLQNHFWDKDTKTNQYGFPEVNADQQAKLKKNYWKVYFAEVEAFLIERLQALNIPAEKTAGNMDDAELNSLMATDSGDIELPEDMPTDLPF